MVGKGNKFSWNGSLVDRDHAAHSTFIDKKRSTECYLFMARQLEHPWCGKELVGKFRDLLLSLRDWVWGVILCQGCQGNTSHPCHRHFVWWWDLIFCRRLGHIVFVTCAKHTDDFSKYVFDRLKELRVLVNDFHLCSWGQGNILMAS